MASDPEMVKRLMRWVQKIEGHRDGHYNYEVLSQKAVYIESELRNMGFLVERDVFQFRGRSYWNIIATEGGFNKNSNWVLVGAHYDAVAGSPGADDNASGLAVMLEVARAIGPEPGLVFVGFTLEEPQPMATHFLIGSRHFVEWTKKKGQKFKAVLVLESVGYRDTRPESQLRPALIKGPDRGDFLAIIGDKNSKELVKHYEKASQEVGLKSFSYIAPFKGHLLPETRFSDHAPFWDAGFPALMLTDTAMFRNPYYHTAEDTSDKLDPEFMVLVAEATIRAVKGLL